MNTGDIRYGQSPFPYGDLYDRGITLNRTVGVAEDPLGLTEGVAYISLTLHRNYAEYAAMAAGVPDPWTSERTIYIKEELLGDVSGL